MEKSSRSGTYKTFYERRASAGLRSNDSVFTISSNSKARYENVTYLNLLLTQDIVELVLDKLRQIQIKSTSEYFHDFERVKPHLFGYFEKTWLYGNFPPQLWSMHNKCKKQSWFLGLPFLNKAKVDLLCIIPLD